MMERQAGPGIVPVANETHNSLTRVTKSGKTLRYDLHIIQQPERARACGAGAKASADRRPVDPPPILQLQIYDILPNGDQHDVTFTMHANYFLFAMLERCRNIAQPRGTQPDNTKHVDVLTGTNVTGMQPFDRPTPAIYFIFPDLSVRHEGRYRLLFSLFEHVRRPEDEDRNDMSPMDGQTMAIHRMDVRSKPFDVYSAKRFPGLSESTNLSRTFAEQGSRIRIRRDVRMRRRDTKGGKDWDDYDDDNANGNSHMPRLSQTPDPYTSQVQQPRPRSSGSQQIMQQAVPRRTSVNDLGQQYQMTQPNNFAFPGSYNPTTTQQYTQASILHPPPQMPMNGYQTQPMMPQQQQNMYSYAPVTAPQQSMTQLQYPALNTNFDAPYQTRNSGEFSAMSTDSRRTSMQSLVPQPQSHIYSTGPSHPQTALSHPLDSSRAHGPPEPVQPPTRVTTPNPPTLTAKPTFGTTLPPISTSFPHRIDAPSPSTLVPASAYNTGLPTPTEVSHKRSYGSTFPTSWQNSSHKQGARPADMPQPSMFLAADGDGDDTTDLGDNSYLRLYRRAGGHTVQRQMP